MIRNAAPALGRFKRAPMRWDAEFGQWVRDFGAPRIVSALASRVVPQPPGGGGF